MVPSSSKYKLSTPVVYREVKGNEKSPSELGDQKEAAQHREGNQTLMGPKTKASRQETDSPLTGRTYRQRRRAQLLDSTQNMAVKMPLAAFSSTPAATTSPWISSQTPALRLRPDRSKTKSIVSLQKQPTSQQSGTRTKNIATKSSPRLSDGEREGTERNMPRRPVERRSDTGSSVVSMKTASSESRTSGEPCYEVTGQIMSPSLQGGPAFMTGPRHIKQGTSLPSVKPKCLARRLSEPMIPTTVSLTRCDISPIQPAPRHPSKVPAHQTCWGVKPHLDPSSIPVLVTPVHETNIVAGLDPKSTQHSRNHRSIRNIKLDGVDLAEDENEDEHEEEGEDDDDDKNLDQRVMTWLDGLDSATCRRFMRKQMAALQEIDDTD